MSREEVETVIGALLLLAFMVGCARLFTAFSEANDDFHWDDEDDDL